MRQKRGFTLLEIILVLAIAGIMASIGFFSFSNASKVKTLQTITDGIISTLEKAKASAETGGGGQSFGVKFASSSYVYFSGSSYNASSSGNVSYPVDSAFTVSTTLANPDLDIIFSRLTGAANATATITVLQTSNPLVKKKIKVESLGTISVI